MNRQTYALLRHPLFLLLLLLLANLALAAPRVVDRSQANRLVRVPSRYLAGEQALLQRSRLLAKPLDLTRYAGLVTPPTVDYSNLVTYVRCQDLGGGCMVYACLSAADIINEWQAPYTPDLSWQYCLRTWEETYKRLIDQNPNTGAPDLNAVFMPGVASEGLYRSESDYLIPVPVTDPKYKPLRGDRMWYDPAPTAEAKEEAQQYKFSVSEPITPSVDTLKALLVSHGPVWSAGPWWWNGAHAMCFVGYNDATKQFRCLNSQGDWADENGFLNVPYDKLTQWVSALRTLTPLPTVRYSDRWAYSSRIRIRGTWRGTWYVNIGVQGQVPQTVYRTYGRRADMPYAYGERLDLDVPLPAYAPQFWPPKQSAKWYLQVEDNDRDGQTGQVIEWILARRYADPSCHSVDQWKTETYKYSGVVNVPDATGTPIANPKPSRDGVPSQKNSQSGMVTLNLPQGTAQLASAVANVGATSPKIDFDKSECKPDQAGMNVFVGELTSTITGKGMANAQVEFCQMVTSENVNKPAYWKRLALTRTDPAGRFVFRLKLPGSNQTVGAAYRPVAGKPALCSTEKLYLGTMVY